MSGLFARQAWASASKLRSTALRAPKTAFTCKVNSVAPRRCFSVSMNRKYCLLFEAQSDLMIFSPREEIH
jgi:hypothetical protein